MHCFRFCCVCAMFIIIIICVSYRPWPLIANMIFICCCAGTEVITVVATDADEPNNANSDIRYKILSQNPPLLKKDTFSFSINNITGKIHVDTAALDKEVHFNLVFLLFLLYKAECAWILLC